MNLNFDPTTSEVASLFVTRFQTAGTLLTAVLFLLLTRGIPGRFLTYWSRAWAALAAALISLSLAFLLGPLLSPTAASWFVRIAQVLYCVFGYLFGFYLWAGCRAFAGGPELRPREWFLFAGPAVFGVLGPMILVQNDLIFPFHSAVLAGFFLLAGLATRRVRPDGRHMVIGLQLLQGALFGLALLFCHYAVVMGWWLVRGPGWSLGYLHYSALYDGLLETVLAFGMVVLATDSVRRTLERANRELGELNCRLAAALDQLAVAARTDPLTGLLNRRAYEDMRAEWGAGPFAGSVAVVDVNFLKRLNDVHGHAAGDAAIQLVARALRGHFRITDLVFRMGGDEFLVVLEGGRAAELAGRLVSVDGTLRASRLPGVPTPVDVVIAWGMADFETLAEFEPAIARADQAMYECKQQRKAPTPVG